MSTLAAAVAGLLTAWVLTVPLHRYKELRPAGRRDIANESGVVVRAVLRHARYAGSTLDVAPTDVVPVVSWFARGARTGRRAPLTAVALQVALPATMACTSLRFSEVALLVAYCWFCVLAVAVAVTDARILLIPWWMPWVGTAGGAVLLPVAAMALEDPQPERILWAAASGLGAFVLFFVLFVAAPGRLGFSDVRLAVPIGVFTGFVSPLLVLWALMIGSLLGVVGGIASRVLSGERHFAFGPALAAGALVAVWLSPSLLG